MKISKTELLENAVFGFEARKAEIEQKISEIEGALSRTPGFSSASSPEPAAKKHRISPEGRARIAAAARRRWAKVKRAKARA